MTAQPTTAKAARPERGPVRTCVGCRRTAPSDELVRITRCGGVVDVDGPSRGRGAWLCRAGDGAVDAGCLRQALRRRGFERAWRGALGDSERAVLNGLAHPIRRMPGGSGEGLTTGKG